MALFGNYEELVEQPIALTSGVPFICFTDDPSLTSETWEIRVVKGALPGDSVRSARAIKIRGHESLDGYERTLWIDNTVLLKRDPAELLDDWLAESDFALPRHSYRGTVAAEFDIVTSSGLDDLARVREQLDEYAQDALDVLGGAALWTALLARRPSKATKQTMQIWLDNVLRYSRRDQLSIGYAIASSGQSVNIVDIDNFESEWHQWPVASGRRAKGDVARATDDGTAAASEIARLHADIDEITLQLSKAVARRESYISWMSGSKSWRWTTPLRSLMGAAQGVRRARNKP
jgi:hypothetical protein